MGLFDTAAALQWGSQNAFRGADMTRLSADRWTGTNHPDTEVRYALRTLRAASRDLFRNNPYAEGIAKAVEDNVVGWEGIRCKPRVLVDPSDPMSEQDRDTNLTLERGWSDWSDEYAMVDGIGDWLEAQRLLARAWVTDGEVFVRHHRAWDNPHGYAIELIDPDLLDEDFNESRDQRGREIVMGVEVDEYGRPLAYHFWKSHPDDMRRRERVRVPAADIVHHFVRYRPGQHRGFPWLTPGLTTFEMIDGYTEAELVAARYHASKMGFITNNEPEAVAQYAVRLAIQSAEGKGTVSRPMKMSPGLIPELQPGQGFTSSDPTHPSDAFDPFLKALLRGIAQGVGMSYLTLTGDVSAANYSSMRAGLLPERDHWKAIQNIFARRVHRPIRRRWVGMALLTGAVDLSGVASDYYPCEWRGRRWQWVDPANDLAAAEAEVKLGVNSRQQLASDRGRDYEVVIDETAEDQAYARAAGVFVGGVNAPPPPAKPAQNGNGVGAVNRLAPYTEVTHE